MGIITLIHAILTLINRHSNADSRHFNAIAGRQFCLDRLSLELPKLSMRELEIHYEW